MSTTEHLEFTYKLSGTVCCNELEIEQAKKYLQQAFDQITSHIMGEGLITGDSPLELESYDAFTEIQS